MSDRRRIKQPISCKTKFVLSVLLAAQFWATASHAEDDFWSGYYQLVLDGEHENLDEVIKRLSNGEKVSSEFSLNDPAFSGLLSQETDVALDYGYDHLLASEKAAFRSPGDVNRTVNIKARSNELSGAFLINILNGETLNFAKDLNVEALSRAEDSTLISIGVDSKVRANDIEQLRPAEVNIFGEFNAKVEAYGANFTAIDLGRLPLFNSNTISIEATLAGDNSNLISVNSKDAKIISSRISIDASLAGKNSSLISVNSKDAEIKSPHISIDASLQGENSHVISIGNDSSLTIRGTELNISSNSKDAAINLGSGSSLTLVTGLSLTSQNLLSGRGTLEVSGTQSIRLVGDINSFNGIYRQVGGSFYLDGKADFSQGWYFNGVAIETNSQNLFDKSVAEYDGSALLRPVFDGKQNNGAFTEIKLTDEKVSLHYLLAASRVHPSSLINYSGELYVDDKVVSEVTLNKNFGVLDAANSHLILSSVLVNLENTDTLRNKTLYVGAVKSRKDTLKLDKTDLALYGTKDSVSHNLKLITVGDGSRLRIHGENFSSQRQPHYANLEAAVDVQKGGLLEIGGYATTGADAAITNNGKVAFLANSHTIMYSDLTQQSGELEVGQGATVNSDGKFTILGGTASVKGSVTAKDFEVKSGSLSVSGYINSENFSVVSETQNRVKADISGHLVATSIDLNNADLVLDGSKNLASLSFNRLDGTNSSIDVKNRGLLIIGDAKASSHPGFTVEDAYNTASQITHKKDLAILVVNEPIQINGEVKVSLGSTGEAAEPKRILLGSNSAMMIRPQMAGAAFVSKEQGGAVVLEDNSHVLVVDPFEDVHLVDESTELVGAEKATLHSANRNLTLKMEQRAGSGWFVTRDKVLSQNFIYPVIQDWLYNKADGFTVNSSNEAFKFFARADNDQYMNSKDASSMISQATQLGSLLGLRRNILISMSDQFEEQSSAITTVLTDPKKTNLVYGKAQGGYFMSHKHKDYLSGSSYNTSYETITVGIASRMDNGLATSLSAAVGLIQPETHHSVVDASADQVVAGFTGAIGKKFKRALVQFDIGGGFSTDRVKGTLPYTMETDRLKLRMTNAYLTTSVSVEAPITKNINASFAPRLWYFLGKNERTKIGSQNAFNLKADSQTLVDLPLKASISNKWFTYKAADFKTKFELGASARVGQLNKKGDLSISGAPVSQRISQKEFNRWTAFASSKISLDHKMWDADVGVYLKTGEGKLDTQVAATARLHF